MSVDERDLPVINSNLISDSTRCFSYKEVKEYFNKPFAMVDFDSWYEEKSLGKVFLPYMLLKFESYNKFSNLFINGKCINLYNYEFEFDYKEKDLSILPEVDIIDRLILIGKDITEIKLFADETLIYKQSFPENTNYAEVSPFEYGIIMCAAKYSDFTFDITAKEMKNVYAECLFLPDEDRNIILNTYELKFAYPRYNTSIKYMDGRIHIKNYID